MRSILIALPLYAFCSHAGIRDYLKRLLILPDTGNVTLAKRKPRKRLLLRTGLAAWKNEKTSPAREA
jgi:hypothetical protein